MNVNCEDLPGQDRIVYLGSTLVKNTKAHAQERIKASRMAFYALQGAELCVSGKNT